MNLSQDWDLCTDLFEHFRVCVQHMLGDCFYCHQGVGFGVLGFEDDAGLAVADYFEEVVGIYCFAY